MHFYNTPECSARAGLDHSYGAYGGPATDISYDTWVDHVKTKSANPQAKIYLGLAASTSATFGNMYLSPDEAQKLVEKFQCKWPTMFGGVMLWEATFSDNNQINGMSYGKNIKKGLENCSCANKPTSTSTAVTSSTMSSTSVPTASPSSVGSSSEEYPTSTSASSSSSAVYPTSNTTVSSESPISTSSCTSDSEAYPTSDTSSEEYPISTSASSSSSAVYPISNTTVSPEYPVTASSSSVESSSTSSHSPTYYNVTMSSTTSASATPCPSSSGVKGFDKSPAYNFLNDTMTANFVKCSARCNADSACVSFAFGTTQCLLYTQTV